MAVQRSAGDLARKSTRSPPADPPNAPGAQLQRPPRAEGPRREGSCADAPPEAAEGYGRCAPVSRCRRGRCAAEPAPSLADTRRAPRASASRATAAHASAPSGPTTVTRCGRRTPAFSVAIEARVGSEVRLVVEVDGDDGGDERVRRRWSRRNDHPRPTSITKTATPPAEVDRGRHGQDLEVGGMSADAARLHEAIGGRLSPRQHERRRASSSIATPSTAIRSFTRTRCGDVNSPVRRPEARSTEATYEATEPLPFVPATRRTGA